MMSSESWLEVQGNQVMLISENDGWSFLRRGPERDTTPVIIAGVEINGPRSRVWYRAGGYRGVLTVSSVEAERWQGWIKKNQAA
jgi:hypothetical protein